MSTQPLQQAQAISRGVLEHISSDQMSNATPCASWDVAGLVNHIVGGQHFFASAMEGQAPSGDAPDFASGDYLSAFDEGSTRCLAAFAADGALGQTVSLPFGDMPGQAFMGLAMTDTFQHAWDLAKSTGQSTDLGPEMAEQLLQASQAAIQDSFRGDEGAPFGAQQSAPEGAPAADQLAAFLGRSV
jgi:uncharacterized protein (TIGR03086 family)